MDGNASSKFKSLAIRLILEWIIFHSFNLFLIKILLLISCNFGSKRFKIPILWRRTYLSGEFNWIILAYFSTSYVLLEIYEAIQQLF